MPGTTWIYGDRATQNQYQYTLSEQTTTPYSTTSLPGHAPFAMVDKERVAPGFDD
jgi:hypothetical protein